MSSINSDNTETSPENLAADELYDLFKKNKKEITRCNIEIIWITKFLQENAPDFLKNAPKYLLRVQREANASVVTPSLSKRISKASRKSSKYQFAPGGRSTVASSFQPVQLNHFMVDTFTKINLCDKQSAKIEEEMAKNETQNTNLIKRLEEQIEELEMNEKDYKMIIETFDSYVMGRGVDPVSGKIPFKVFIKFVNQVVASVNKMTDSMHRQTSIARTKTRKLNNEIEDRKELSGLYKPVDVEKLQLVNNQLRRSEMQNKGYYMGMREKAAKAALAAKIRKKEYLEVIETQNSLIEYTKRTEENVQKLGWALVNVRKESQAIQQEITELEEKSKQYKAPTVLEYIEKLEGKKELIKQLKIAERKNRIAKITFLNTKQEFLKMNKI